MKNVAIVREFVNTSLHVAWILFWQQYHVRLHGYFFQFDFNKETRQNVTWNVNTGNMLVKFYVQKYPMIASCDRQSMYADLCNGDTSSNDVKVIADGFN